MTNHYVAFPVHEEACWDQSKGSAERLCRFLQECLNQAEEKTGIKPFALFVPFWMRRLYMHACSILDPEGCKFSMEEAAPWHPRLEFNGAPVSSVRITGDDLVLVSDEEGCAFLLELVEKL
jgi:hypothetical protein